MLKIENIEGFPGYHVTKNGEVYSNLQGEWTRRSTFLTVDGYEYVTMVDENGEKRKKGVHVLVALAHIGQAPEGCRKVIHLNGNRSDNRVSNLAWK